MKKNLFLLLFVLLSKSIWASFVYLPMDHDNQKNHLKSYGIVYYALQNGLKAKWLLNYDGGAFLIENNEAVVKECKIRGVSFEVISDAKSQLILEEISSPSKNQEAVTLEKAPKIAVYSPKDKLPWDDAVTMVLTYAEIPFDVIYDEEVLDEKLLLYEWLHLHHEDFTGQYGRFYGPYRTAPWYIQRKKRAEDLATKLGFDKVSQEKLAVAKKIRDYVIGGGFMFAMCSATDSFDIALSAEGVDICEAMFDGDASESNYTSKIDYDRTFAFKDYSLIRDPTVYEFSSIDMTRKRKIQKESDYFILREFSAKWDQVPTMLCQNHTQVVKAFMGQTTSFDHKHIK